jgi:hypothetical protein
LCAVTEEESNEKEDGSLEEKEISEIRGKCRSESLQDHPHVTTMREKTSALFLITES